jgi:hypothetical protein
LFNATLAFLKTSKYVLFSSNAFVLVRFSASSNGLMVCMLITSAEIPFASNASAAISAYTKCPVATIVTSVPSLSIVLPMKGSSAGVKLATGRPKRK